MFLGISFYKNTVLVTLHGQGRLLISDQIGSARWEGWLGRETEVEFSSISIKYAKMGASLIAQLVKNAPAIQETLILFMGWEDSPGEGTGSPLQYSWASLVS